MPPRTLKGAVNAVTDILSDSDIATILNFLKDSLDWFYTNYGSIVRKQCHSAENRALCQAIDIGPSDSDKKLYR
jgi:hypothetical protein